MATMLKREAARTLPTHQSERGRTLALLLLSATAGSTDAIGFLGLNGLFTAHITGNIVILAGHLVAQGRAGVAEMISVPIFMVVLGLARLIGLALDRYGKGAAERALLILQFALLLGFFLLCLPLGRTFDADAPWVTLAGMCGVAAMAVQNVLVQISIPGAPSTVVLTTNITRFTVATVESVAGPATNRRAALEKVAATFPPIVGFLIGCAAGCFLEWQIGLPALLLPVVLSLAALLVTLT
jgi:uncharacterized membrane protein YoaK (UPF0700 family)